LGQNAHFDNYLVPLGKEEKVVSEVILIIVGGLLIIFRRQFVRIGLAFQNKVFGFQFNEKDIKTGEVFVPLLGAFMIALAVFNMFR